jgi:hypothetical protein
MVPEIHLPHATTQLNFLLVLEKGQKVFRIYVFQIYVFSKAERVVTFTKIEPMQ